MNAFKIFLFIHIISGSAGLITGTLNIIRRKGDKLHRRAGKLFLFAMIMVAASAFVLSVMHPNYFLFVVAVFTLYLTGTGQRYLSLKNLSKGQKPKFLDWALTGSMLTFGLIFMGFGTYHILSGITFGVVFLVFGFIGLSMSFQDFRNYTGTSSIKNVWFTTHIQRMTGAYIAALTATLVVNFPSGILPAYLAFIPWLLPTAILTPYIFKWTKKFRVNVQVTAVKNPQ